MYNLIFDPNSTKEVFYKDLLIHMEALLEGQRNWVRDRKVFQNPQIVSTSKRLYFQVTNLANASALIFHGLNTLTFFQEKPVNWAGFYLREDNSPNLVLGPFQGKVIQNA